MECTCALVSSFLLSVFWDFLLAHLVTCYISIVFDRKCKPHWLSGLMDNLAKFESQLEGLLKRVHSLLFLGLYWLNMCVFVYCCIIRSCVSFSHLNNFLIMKMLSRSLLNTLRNSTGKYNYRPSLLCSTIMLLYIVITCVLWSHYHFMKYTITRVLRIYMRYRW